MRRTIALAGLGSAACALGGDPAMAGVFLVLLMLAAAVRRMEERIDEVQALLLIK